MNITVAEKLDGWKRVPMGLAGLPVLHPYPPPPPITPRDHTNPPPATFTLKTCQASANRTGALISALSQLGGGDGPTRRPWLYRERLDDGFNMHFKPELAGISLWHWSRVAISRSRNPARIWSVSFILYDQGPGFIDWSKASSAIGSESAVRTRA